MDLKILMLEFLYTEPSDLQGQDSIVLAQRQKYTSMEQDRKSRDKSMHV